MAGVRRMVGGATNYKRTWRRSGGSARLSKAGGASAPGFGQWKAAGGTGGRGGSNLKTANDWDVAPLKGSTGGPRSSGRKIRG